MSFVSVAGDAVGVSDEEGAVGAGGGLVFSFLGASLVAKAICATTASAPAINSRFMIFS
jgi:hypothetical protein